VAFEIFEADFAASSFEFQIPFFASTTAIPAEVNITG
jgi:hypothetical protein